MAEFLVELYLARDDCAALKQSTKRARRVADLLDEKSGKGRYLRSIFVPEDETFFLMYEAPSADAVRAAAAEAGLPFERIIEAVAD